MQEALGVFVSTLAAPNEREVRDHLPLVLLVAELVQDDGRLLEVLNRLRDAAGGVDEREGQVVQRQRLCAPVTELTQDPERGPMLLGRLFVIAFAPKLCAELIESKRSAVQACRGWFSLTKLRRVSPDAPSGSLDTPTATCAERAGATRGDLCERAKSPLDRSDRNPQSLSHPVAPHEPECSDRDASDDKRRQRSEKDDSQSERRQEPGQEEPHPGGCENATAQLLRVS